jgi:hypothetical protein
MAGPVLVLGLEPCEIPGLESGLESGLGPGLESILGPGLGLGISIHVWFNTCL